MVLGEGLGGYGIHAHTRENCIVIAQRIIYHTPEHMAFHNAHDDTTDTNAGNQMDVSEHNIPHTKMLARAHKFHGHTLLSAKQSSRKRIIQDHHLRLRHQTRRPHNRQRSSVS